MAKSVPTDRIPTECLSGELAGVWSGWMGLGDREIVREASAKGTHIELAYKFLEIRRHCPNQEAKVYFSDEVEIWVSSLLKKKQVHRASHILKNVGKIPLDYIRAACLKCKEPSLRDYMAKHVELSFNAEERKAWDIINFVAKYEEQFDLGNDLISHKCLEEIINLPESIKDALYTELYFHHYDPSITVYLKNDVVWDFLLMNNKLDLIKLWIDFNFNNSKDFIPKNIEHIEDLQKLFTNLKITDTMISSVETSNAMVLVKQLVLNSLSRYGIFANQERNDVKAILSRFFEECIPVSDFNQILSQPMCNVDKQNFFSKLDIVGLSRNYSEDSESETINMKNKQLFEHLKNMCNTTNNANDFVEVGIVESIKYLSNDSVQFLKENPIIAFTLIFLHYSKYKKINNEITLKEIFNNNAGLIIQNLPIPKCVLDTVIVNLPYLKNEIDSNMPKNSITMYELLDGYKNFNSKKFFKWRHKNEGMPDFLNENLVNKFGHKEKLTYINYLKEARPNMAVHALLFQQEKLVAGISSKVKSQASLYAHIFALQHLNEIEVVSGCISFLEILGVNSEILRLHVTAAEFVKKELNTSIESLLRSVIYNNHHHDLQLVLSYLERSFHSCLNTKMIKDSNEFIDALCTWDVIVRFAKIHNASLPISLLKFLASIDAWFEFVLVGHIFSYPIHQMLQCVQNFESIALREHLLLSLNNNQLLDKHLFNENENVKDNGIEENDSFQELKDQVKDVAVRQSASQPFSNDNKQNSTIPNSFTNADSCIDDLWMIILKCHQSQDPPGALLKASKTFKSPILTVLATCYEPSSISSYCYSWLIISVEDIHFTKDYEECLEKQIWPASTVSNLFKNMISYGFVKTLSRGLQIFMPDNPLKLFFEFLLQCIEYGNFKGSEQHLDDFINDCLNYKCNRMINWECSDGTYLENIFWIQTIVVKCIIVTLGQALQSTLLQLEFLNILIKLEFRKKLIVNAPDFEALREYTRILSETSLSLNFSRFDTTVQIYESEIEIEKCVNELVRLEDYGNALQLSKAANLKVSKIILAQYQSEYKQNADKDGIVSFGFWSRCATDFKKYEVHYEKAAEFFVEHAEKVKSHKERYEILKLALEILEENSRDRQLCDTVEMAMWKSCILAGPENIEINTNDKVYKKLKTELLSSISELKVTCSLTEPTEQIAIEVLIGRLLDAGRLDTAFRIGAIFNCKNRELQVLMLCLSLAEGEILPQQLTDKQRSLLTESEKPRQRNTALRSRGLQQLPSLSSLSLSSSNANLSSVSDAISASIIVEQQEQLDCLSLLTNLIETLKHGVNIGIRILLCYRLALQLGKSYQALLTLKNPMQFLQEIISSSCDRKLEITRDIITAYQIENQQIACFLAEEIVAHITQIIEDGFNEPTTAWNYNINLQSIIELCKDSSLLGLKLLDMAHKLLGHSHGENRNLVILKIIVELLIRSHDCFTSSCNMEGIASVLRKCQQLANSLQNLKHWSLLVRLVTGVGRFTEMNYIFQILKEHDQFEFLLGRGLDKVPGLRMALLDFLKRHCPENKDLFNIVALHFRLYYEIALMWENEAKDIINDLVSDTKKECGRSLSNPQVELKFTKNESTEKKLQLIIANFTHATQYFLQDNKLNLANRCSHQAQLVALQISLLNGSSANQQFPCLLNLSNDEVSRTITQHLSFSQTLVLARAYEHHIDWASAIYSHCLVNGDAKYLKEFVASKWFTPSVAIDCAKRYKLEKSATKPATENMRALVAKINDTECKYALARQLGFNNIVDEMLEDPAVGTYLKDTVLMKRYVISEFMSESFLSK
ncbi:PREDICTED: spatacsin [Ceratosolen solmsi marchali]|uniref:Spatacsin n=1 Tax=Ceratosolen solmsi marchali TaxID=326594 RepID=A0AAJ6YLE9_9HYME|nr:PREDICTED: spatacsin [Ceratosolen solmsi marchali]